MKPCHLSWGGGLLIGVLHSLFGVRSPAPPVIVLAGLATSLLGEELVRARRGSPAVRRSPSSPRPRRSSRPAGSSCSPASLHGRRGEPRGVPS
jgi:XapX domain-containing protein